MAKNLSELKRDLKKFAKVAADTIKKELPIIVKTEGLNHFEESWDNQGFTDKSLDKWQKRKAPPAITKSGKPSAAYDKWARKDAGRAILVGHQADSSGGHLKDSLKASATTKAVIFSSDKEYAEVHNEGGRSGRGKGFQMPRRRFMGPSKVLNDKIFKKLEKEITKKLDSTKL
jgi:phage gpG-like protein